MGKPDGRRLLLGTPGKLSEGEQITPIPNRAITQGIPLIIIATSIVTDRVPLIQFRQTT